jgi:hypothetical protein
VQEMEVGPPEPAVRGRLQEPVAPMLRETLKWDAPVRARVPMRGTGTEQLAVGSKAL